ncbi:MAG: hypothetical protein COW76_12705 [Shewanella sp. CG18_big_fil_WC_8_21_14_2_50_42_11]|uniref:hypothetical protein n=1 Tax=Shewanella TaxID=22 RepID=UPI000C53A847|nr:MULTISPECIES: hypothetical protein [Shewanella]NCP70509.1 hypothetical protein [Shewanella vesiculosa]PIQ00117.1 MAG: hypothetical protein COW76_12705 [Shewanella sp. CG18_big_fil_WC_8_21_14_2_50_42_11]
MKIILMLVLVAIALYLYRRTQAVAKQELDKTDSNATEHSSSSEVAQPSSPAATDTADAEHKELDKPAADVVLGDSVINAPQSTSATLVDEPSTTANTSPVDTQQAELTTEPDAELNDSETTDTLSHANSPSVNASPVDTPNVKLTTKPDAEPNDSETTDTLTHDETGSADTSATAVSTLQAGGLSLEPAKGDWASESLQQQVEVANNATDLQGQHDGLVSVINHCYKMRKQADYCQYGAALQLTYLELYRSLHQQHVAQKNTDDIKAPAFMQLSTLLNDVGQFDEALKVCQQALEYQLTDGTVTGFEGRIKRIEKAKAKAS